MSRILLHFSFVLSLAVGSSSAAAPATATATAPIFSIEPFATELEYAQPVPIERKAPSYPRRAAGSGTTGFVEISLMVDSQGSPFEPVVERSTNSIFEDNSLAAVSKYEFSPAMLGGQPVEGRVSLSVIFQMEGQYNYVSKGHSNKLRQINEDIEKLATSDDRMSRINAGINSLFNSKSISYCGLAHTYLAQQQLAQKLQNTESEIGALQFLQAFDKRTELTNSDGVAERWMCFSEQMDQDIDLRLLALHLAEGDIASGLREVAIVDHPEHQERRQLLTRFLSQHIENLKIDNETASHYEIPKSGYQLIEVLNHSLTIETKEGNLNKAKFRCDAGFLEMALSSETKIDVPTEFGRCQLQVIGDVGTSFSLIEPNNVS